MLFALVAELNASAEGYGLNLAEVWQHFVVLSLLSFTAFELSNRFENALFHCKKLGKTSVFALVDGALSQRTRKLALHPSFLKSFVSLFLIALL